MIIALTTRWNAGRHTRGEDMVEEILDMGFQHLELGYDTRLDLVPGIQHMVQTNAVTVNSVHNFCPVPMSAHRGHPEIYTFSSTDRRIRELAVTHTAQTIRFAAEIGASTVVTHCGNIEMKRFSEQLIVACEEGRQFTPQYEKLKLKLQITRDKKARKQLPLLYECLEQLVPLLTETGVCLALENLPTWEAVPTETELETLLQHFNTPHLRYWHDMGHGQIRENMGLINHERWLERLQGHMAGMHVHDVHPPGRDHIMPPHGHIDFSRFHRFAALNILRVIEPTPHTPREEIVEGLQFLRKTWSDASTASSPHA